MSVTNFEDITYELTAEEQAIAGFVEKVIRSCTDETKAKKAKDIVYLVNHYIASEYNPKAAKMTEVRLRKFVNYYRSHGYIPICASSKGYFISFENEVLQLQVKSLKERAGGIHSAARGLEKWIK